MREPGADRSLALLLSPYHSVLTLALTLILILTARAT
jgi:hypothetical protein